MRCGDPRWMAKNFGFLEMSNFNIYVCFWNIFGIPNIWVIPCWVTTLEAVTGHSWLTLVGNSNNELCSPLLKAFWQKKVLPEQRISYCEGIYIYLSAGMPLFRAKRQIDRLKCSSHLQIGMDYHNSFSPPIITRHYHIRKCAINWVLNLKRLRISLCF